MVCNLTKTDSTWQLFSPHAPCGYHKVPYMYTPVSTSNVWKDYFFLFCFTVSRSPKSICACRRRSLLMCKMCDLTQYPSFMLRTASLPGVCCVLQATLTLKSFSLLAAPFFCCLHVSERSSFFCYHLSEPDGDFVMQRAVISAIPGDWHSPRRLMI